MDCLSKQSSKRLEKEKKTPNKQKKKGEMLQAKHRTKKQLRFSMKFFLFALTHLFLSFHLL
jgi:hypothetical protein